MPDKAFFLLYPGNIYQVIAKLPGYVYSSYSRHKSHHSAAVNAKAAFGNIHLLYIQFIQLLSLVNYLIDIIAINNYHIVMLQSHNHGKDR